MGQFKKVQVVMLPTESKTGIQLAPDNTFRFTSNNSWTSYALYFISDEKLEDGDWCFYKNGDLEGVRQIIDGQRPKTMILRKIIATTDALLIRKRDIVFQDNTSDYVYDLPQPSQQFLEKYIDAYNRGDIITEVEVEYESYSRLDHPNMANWEQLKINSDNTINIKSAKESWKRDEVRGLLISLHNEYPDRWDLENWINKNL